MKKLLVILLSLLSISVFAKSPPKPQPTLAQDWGTGFFINDQGYMITAAHVVKNSEGTISSRVFITINNQQYEAQSIAIDAEHDIALLKFNLINTPYLTISSQEVNFGDKLIAWGYGEPFILKWALLPKLSIVLARHQALTDDNAGDNNHQYDSILAEGALLPGDSGGPVLNDWGEVVGSNDYSIGSAVTGFSRIEYGVKLIKDAGSYYYTEDANIISHELNYFFGYPKVPMNAILVVEHDSMVNVTNVTTIVKSCLI